MMLSYFSIFLFAFQAAGSALYDTNSPAISRVSTGQWAKLNKTVGGRLAQGLPLAAPCYSQVNGRPNLQADPSKCEAIQAQKTSSPFLTTQFGTYIYVRKRLSSGRVLPRLTSSYRPNGLAASHRPSLALPTSRAATSLSQYMRIACRALCLQSTSLCLARQMCKPASTSLAPTGYLSWSRTPAMTSEVGALARMLLLCGHIHISLPSN